MTATGRDFPFYDGSPSRITVGGWLMVMALTALGFSALVGLPTLWPSRAAVWAGTALFVALPLLSLRLAAGRHWKTAFHHPTRSDVAVGLGCALLCMATSVIVDLIIRQAGATIANPAVAALAEASPLDVLLFFAQTGPQLVGEELVTILPFLAVLTGLHAMKAPRWAAIGGAWIASAVLFAALHLPTYGWNVLQAIAVIGSARLALTLAYVATKNIWASVIAHIANDWTLFGIVVLAAAIKSH